MEEITIKLVKKIENKTIALKDFYDVLMEEKIDNVIKFIAILSENPIIDGYLSSFFSNQKYTEEEIIKKYGEFEGNILVSYAIIKNLLDEENIDYKDIDVKELSALNLFFKDIANLPVLSKEENLKYVKRYQENKKLGNNTLCEYYRNLIAEGNIRLIIYIARKNASAKVPLEDLINEGFFGLAKAIEHYDFSYDCAFSTYAIFWIKKSIMMSIQSKERSIRLPVGIQIKYNKYLRMKEELSNKLGRNATNEEVAIAMGESIKAIDTLIITIKNTVSLDEKVSDDNEDDRYNFIIDKTSSFEEEYINKETVLKLIECLNEKEKEIIIKRYILDYTLDKVGKMYSITRERVRQIEIKALRKMKSYYFGAEKKLVKRKINDLNSPAKVNTYGTLSEILGLSFDDTVFFISTLDKSSNLYNLIIKCFGNDLKGYLNKNKLDNKFYKELVNVLNFMKNIINSNNNFKDKYLSNIVSISLDDIKVYISEEEMTILKRAFGENLDRKFINTVRIDILEKIINHINEQVKEAKMIMEKETKKVSRSKYDNMTLDMILGISYEEIITIFSKYNKDMLIYKVFVKTFGSDLKGKFNLNGLSANEKMVLYSKINWLKGKSFSRMKKSSIKEDNDLNKYYMCIISLMPKEYKTILSLYFENYSLDKIASLMDLDINDVNNKLKEGISFMQEIISLYNKTFNENLSENKKMLR